MAPGGKTRRVTRPTPRLVAEAPEEWIQAPERGLPAPVHAELPGPLPLRAMLGPSVIMAGLSIGSGELVLWPRLTAEWGFAVFWAAWLGVTLQFFVNMEIERWTLATGESAVAGFVRLHPAFGPLLLVTGTLPWIWPGWATGAATLAVGGSPGAVLPCAVAGLVACGLALSLGPVVYRTLEALQAVLVTAIFLSVGVLALAVVRGEHVAALAAGALRLGHVPAGIDLPLFLGALAFAGAGGTVNLAQSNYVKDKGYAMGRYIGRITSPFTGREEAVSEVGVVFRASDLHAARWATWWRRANLEHAFSFLLLCVLSLALFCLLAFALREPGKPPAADFGFLADQARALEVRFGPWARMLFVGGGVAVLLSTELALLDAVSRVAADLLKLSWLRRSENWSVSRIYFAVVWSLIALGALVLLAGFDQPLPLLVLSASLNAFVMALYTALLLWLNATSFRGPLRPPPLRLLALTAAFLFYGGFSVLTLVDQLARLR